MKCKSPKCEFERGHKGLCSYIILRRVTNSVTNRKPKADAVDVGARIHRPPAGERQTDAASRPLSSAKRVSKWRKAHAEENRKRQRELMRKKRKGFIGIAYG